MRKHIQPCNISHVSGCVTSEQPLEGQSKGHFLRGRKCHKDKRFTSSLNSHALKCPHRITRVLKYTKQNESNYNNSWRLVFVLMIFTEK